MAPRADRGRQRHARGRGPVGRTRAGRGRVAREPRGTLSGAGPGTRARGEGRPGREGSRLRPRRKCGYPERAPPRDGEEALPHRDKGVDFEGSSWAREGGQPAGPRPAPTPPARTRPLPRPLTPAAALDLPCDPGFVVHCGWSTHGRRAEPGPEGRRHLGPPPPRPCPSFSFGPERVPSRGRPRPRVRGLYPPDPGVRPEPHTPTPGTTPSPLLDLLYNNGCSNEGQPRADPLPVGRGSARGPVISPEKEVSSAGPLSIRYSLPY